MEKEFLNVRLNQVEEQVENFGRYKPVLWKKMESQKKYGRYSDMA